MRRKAIWSQIIQKLLRVVAMWIILCTVKAMIDIILSLKTLYHSHVYYIDVVIVGG